MFGSNWFDCPSPSPSVVSGCKGPYSTFKNSIMSLTGRVNLPMGGFLAALQLLKICRRIGQSVCRSHICHIENQSRTKAKIDKKKFENADVYNFHSKHFTSVQLVGHSGLVSIWETLLGACQSLTVLQSPSHPAQSSRHWNFHSRDLLTK